MPESADAVAQQLRALSTSVLDAESVEDIVDAFLAGAREQLRIDQVHLIEVSQDAHPSRSLNTRQTSCGLAGVVASYS